jgi:S1-C subfamily serine protease
MRFFPWFLLVMATTAAHAIAPQDEPVVKAVEKVRPAVVNIYTEGVVTQEVRDPRDVFFERYFGGGMSRGNRLLQTPVRNLGSGVIVSPNGYIVTNQHVVDRAAQVKIKVTLADGRETEAVLLRDDDLLDLALIKIKSKEPLPYLALEPLSPNLLGQTVLAIGNPVGYESSVSAGILSAKDRTLTIGDLTLEGLLQTDAAINPGNSGGPLVDAQGNLVGLGSGKMSIAQNLPVDNIGFAIPGERVKRWVEEAIAVVEGKIKAPPERSAALAMKEHFGLELEDCSPEESLRLGYQGRKGLLVTGVEKGGPAAQAGFQEGMLVVGLGKVPARSLEELPRKVRQLKKEDQVPVTVLGAVRQGNFVSLRQSTVILQAR